MSKEANETRPDGEISLADEEATKQILADSILGLWDVVNNLTRLRPSRRDRYRVTIFGSARAKAGTFGYDETKRVAAALAEMGCDIITGAAPASCRRRTRGRRRAAASRDPWESASSFRSSRR